MYKRSSIVFSTLLRALPMALAGLVLISCGGQVATTAPGTGVPASEAGQVTRWTYEFPQKYEPEILYFDPPAAVTGNINGEDYLILSFEPQTSPGSSRIFILSVTDVMAPRLVSTIAKEQTGRNSTAVRSLALKGNTLYAGLFADKGLWIIDVSDPAGPKDLGIARPRRRSI